MCDCCNIEIVCLVFVLELCWWFGGEWQIVCVGICGR